MQKLGEIDHHETIFYYGSPAENLARTYINQIIDNDIQTINNLSVTAGLLVRAHKKNINITQQAQETEQLLNSVLDRQTELTNSQIFKINYREHDQSFQAYINSLADEGLGAAVVTILGIAIGVKYIIAASVIAGAVITYQVIQYLQSSRDGSQVEFNQSRRVIQDILDKLDQEDQDKLIGEINSQLQGAYRRGKWDQFWHTWGKLVRNSALIAGGAIIVFKAAPWLILRQRQKKRNNKN